MNKIFSIQRFKRYLLAGLGLLLIGLIADLAQNFDTFLERIPNNTWLVLYVTILNYFLFGFVRQKLSWKKLFVSLLLLVAGIMACSWGLYLWRETGIALHIYTPLITYQSVSKNVSHQMGYSVGAVFYFGIVSHLYNHLKLKESAKQLRIEKQEAELNYLKSQTNPHFLFNTLNNIYSLARDKSDLAPESILRLSKILRYMLYETSGAYIAIEQELKIIDDYIALEKLRYDDSLRINFNYDIEDMKQAIPPLLLIPLVENAFKHGVSETSDRPFVDIHISVAKRQLVFIVKNSTDTNPSNPVVKENIGLSNLRRQLELLYKDFQLSVQQGVSEFTANLTINLASRV